MQQAHRFHARQEAAARLALARSRDTRVRQFAQAMQRDHGAALAQLQALAAGKRQLLEALPEPRPEQTFGLATLRGSAFDRRFVAVVGIDAHRDALGLFRQQAALAGEQEPVRFATAILPRIERHLAAAQALEAQFELQRRNFDDSGRSDPSPGAG